MTITSAQAQVDLTNCDREPIHTPGAIQPHGCLLAFSAEDCRLRRWSANAADWLGSEPTEGAPLTDLFSCAPQEHVDAILEGGAGIVHPLSLTLSDGSSSFNGAAHHFQGVLILELERVEAGSPPPAVLASLPLRLNLSNQHLQSCDELPELYSAIATEVRSISGFDRVMLYRFLEDGHGAVVGEAVDSRFESFLGLHYPATDIPQQARRLYVLNPVRAIADILAAPVPILPDAAGEGAPLLDLSYCCYRAVSPIHIEYLHNMGVRASMSISILKDGQLWGLIACHHYEPRGLTFEQRAACEMLGLMAGAYLTAREQDDANRQRATRRSRLARLMKSVAEGDSFNQGVYGAAPKFCKTVDADGVAFCWSVGVETWGDVPSESVIEQVVAEHLDPGGDIWQTDNLSAAIGAPPESLGGICGCLTAKLNAPDLRGLVFFRKEYTHEVKWAGDPNKPATQTDDGPRLSPRKSFETWQQTVNGRSREWSEVDIEMADELRSGMIELLGRRAAQLARVNQELSTLNADLDSFAYAASHDLREPLRGLNHTVYLLLEHLGDDASDEVQKRSDALQRLTKRMEELVDGLLRLSRAGRGELQRETFPLEEAARDALDLAFGEQDPTGIELSVTPDLQVHADYLCVRELLTNLISNAVKYNDNPTKQISVGVSDDHQFRAADGRETPVFVVSDNGIGIDPENHDQAFRIFRRLHAPEAYGGGTGAGLTIVKKIVQRHGGRIWLESTPGEGASFFFTLDEGAP